jgi:hypothetical protein
MDSKRFSFARQILGVAGAGLALAAMSGCATVALTNLTPSSLPENPSGIYTFTLRVTPKSSAVIADSIAPKVIVGAEPHDMKRSDVSSELYEFDYKPPYSTSDIAYYYLVTFNTTSHAESSPQQSYTALEHVAIVTRDVLSIEVNRGPVGARIGVLGRGFTPNDHIGFDNNPVRTVYESSTSLGFFVPALPAGRTYQVTLHGDKGDAVVGTFRIDTSDLSVDPASLNLASGQKQTLTFTLSRPAPAGGTLLDVTTDVPESVIMPEVVVPEGASTVSVTVEGGKPGTGSLFLKGYGSGEVTIPVTVSR